MEKLDDIFPKSESIDYLHHSLEKRLGSPRSYDETNLVLQLGSNDPHRLKTCVEHAVQRYSFREINLNCGCPAIESGGAATYGASLMQYPELTKSLVDAVKRGLESVSASDRPKVSVKCRIGVFENAEQTRPLGAEDFDKLHRYITCICEAGASHVVLHARPAVLTGLSPVRNRIVPSLDYEFVQNIATEFEGKIDITLNGGISSLTQIKSLQSDESSVISSYMSGRWCLRRPLDLVDVEGLLTDQSAPTENTNTIKSALENYIDYALTMATLPWRRFTTSELCLPLYLTFEQLKDDWDYYEEDNQSADHPSLSYEDIESLLEVIWRGVIELEECSNKGNKKVQKSNVYKYLSSSFKSLAGKKVVGKWKRNRAEL
jgi:tRNA dihydrouridine synthase A